MKKRWKDPWFWFTLIGLFASVTHIDLESLTSWPIFFAKLEAVFMNPSLIIAFIIALIGQFRNPTTPGLKD